MKKILLSTVALLGVAASASAADLPRRTAPVVYAPVPVFTWTGFYAGINAGYGFGVNDNNRGVAIPTGTAFLPAGTSGVISYSDRDRDGFVGGGQVGFNYQFTPGSGVVIGIEADAQYADFQRSRNNGTFTYVGNAGSTALPGTFVGFNDRNAIDFFGTVRGRLGYAFDRTLVYATGGFAYGDGERSNFNGFSTTFYDSRDTFRTGYTVGGGVEFALAQDSFLNFFGSSAVTAKIEGLYVNLERDRGQGVLVGFNAGNPVFVAGTRRDREDEFAVVRAGLNYKFGTY